MPFIDITMIEGRSADAKREMMKRITDVVEETLAAPRDSIRIVVREVPAFHWAVGGTPKGEPPAPSPMSGERMADLP